MIEMRHGWEFVNKTDCLDYIESHGHVYNHHTCPLGLDTRATCHSDHVSGCCPCCPPVWDGFLCWPPAQPGALVKQPCPANIAQLNEEFSSSQCTRAAHDVTALTTNRRYEGFARVLYCPQRILVC